MAADKLTFSRGVHVREYKELSENSSLFNANMPKEVIIPLSQHIGAPSKAVVKKNDEVKVGQLIGQASGQFSANVHSSVSGVVKEIRNIQTASGRNAQAVVIETDGLDEKIYGKETVDALSLSKEEIVEKMQQAGLVGMGGATFPVHIKYSPAKPIDTVIVNGAECEPYVTCDDNLLRLKPLNIIKGLQLCMKAVDAKKGIIAIEDNKQKAIDIVTQQLKESGIKNIEVNVLKTKYPQGDEKRIIDATLNRQVPSGGLPMDVGVNVSNVSTVNAIYEACYLNKPLFERYITITGNAVKEPHNLLVRIGTSMRELIDQCGGFSTKPGKVISGGPMMGITQQSIDTPVEKGTNCVLVLTEEEAKPPEINPCIRCGKCVSVCPVGLLPLYLSKNATAERFDVCEQFNIKDCIECGSCSYICPAKRPLVESIRFGKRELKKAK